MHGIMIDNFLASAASKLIASPPPFVATTDGSPG